LDVASSYIGVKINKQKKRAWRDNSEGLQGANNKLQLVKTRCAHFAKQNAHRPGSKEKGEKEKDKEARTSFGGDSNNFGKLIIGVLLKILHKR